MYIEALSIYIELRYLITWQGSKIHDIEAKIYYNCNKENGWPTIDVFLELATTGHELPINLSETLFNIYWI